VAPLAARWMERLLIGHKPPLTLTQYLALRAIERGDTSTTELAQRAGVSGPAASQLLAGLADAGLIERERLPDDRRRQRLALSASGRRAFRSAEKMLRAQFGGLLRELPHPDARALARALPFVEAALSGSAPPRRPPGPKPGSPSARRRPPP
jgi:DNA-binding MarR family transcriptional regulator